MKSPARYIADFVVAGNNILDASITLADLGSDVLANLSAVGANISGLTTSNIAEGSNLYYTDARVYANINPLLANLDVGANLAASNTDALAEGITNLYFTDERVYANVMAGGFATESYVDSGIANLVNSAPEALDTLYELANALGNDANFATSISTLIGKSYNQANAAYDEANSKTVAADLTTANVAEVTNLYFTNARVYANVTELGYASNLYVDDRLATKANVTDLTTANVAEDTNLYFTNDRAISAFTAGDNITIDANGLITGEPGYVDENAYANSQIWFANVTTSNVAEGVNLYFTNARVYANVAEIGYAANSYVDDRLATKANAADLTTSNVIEGSNLYFSNDRAIGALTSSDDIIINSNGLLSSNVGAFKTILVNGGANVVAEPNDRIEFVAGAGMTIITNPNVSPKIIAFSANVSGVSGAAGGNLDFGSIVQPVGFTLDLGSII
jgi:hypothetical protein